MQQTKSNEAAQKEIEEAVNRVKEAQQLIPVPLSQEDVTGTRILWHFIYNYNRNNLFLTRKREGKRKGYHGSRKGKAENC